MLVPLSSASCYGVSVKTADYLTLKIKLLKVQLFIQSLGLVILTGILLMLAVSL